jgi:hypothetical protein
MMIGRAWSCVIALVVIVTAMPAAPAAAASLFELNFFLSGPRYDGVLPPCDSPAALDNITHRFAQKEGRFWESDLTIEGFEKIRETSFRSWAPNAIPRRFCSALALVSDGRKHPIHYSIVEGDGMIGGGWGVDWCVVGLDRNWAYNPGCQMARP